MEYRNELTGYPSIDRPWLKYYSKEDMDISIPDCSMYESMYNHAHKYGSIVAIEYMGVKVTYEEMFRRIEACSRALKSFGVKQGDIVSVCLPNIPEAVYCIYAINRVGAVANMLDVRCGASVLEAEIKEAESEILICLDSVTDKLASIRKHTNVNLVVAVSPIESFNGVWKSLLRILKKELRPNISKDFITWNTFIGEGKRYNGIIDSYSKGETDAVIAYTGGTTGEPKGVISTNININAEAEQEFGIGFNMSESDSVLCLAPPWTYYGICNSINYPFFIGARVILIPKFEADELGDLMIKHRSNHVIAVPSTLRILLSGKFDKEDFSFLKSLIVGADKLDESFEEEVNEFLKNHGCSIRVSKGYGMTEVMACAAYTKDNVNQIGSVGIPLPSNVISAFKETDAGMSECHIGEQGEIAICGPTVMKSYFGKFKSENADILKIHSDGTVWAHTGDIGYVGEDGRIYIVGRLKRMFTKAGFKIFPAAIEQCIMACDFVSMAAVVPIEDKTTGFITKAFVVCKDVMSDCDALKDVIEKALSDKLYDYELPDIYEFVDDLPLTGMGKIDYRALSQAVPR